MPNIMNGISVERDEALRYGSRNNAKLQSLDCGREQSQHLLGQGVEHRDVVKGDLVSLNEAGEVIPLRDDRPFAGVVNGVGGAPQGGYTVTTFVRGSICVRVEGLTPDVKLGTKIFATRNGPSESFSLAGPGAEVGELVGIESVERSMGLVGIKLASDTRPYISGDNRRGGLMQSSRG